MNKNKPNEIAEAQASRWQTGESRSADSVLDKIYYNSYQNKRAQAGQQAPVVNGETLSNSQVFLESRAAGISPATASKLSQNRQAYLQEIGERNSENAPRPNLGLVVKAGLSKNASTSSNNGYRIGNSGGNSTHMAPPTYSPLYLTQNLQIPRDRWVANAWNRAFYETNPIVHNAINLHATYPISKLNIKCSDKKVEQFFNDMAERIDLQTAAQSAALELFKIGEAFCYANFDESTGMWDNIYLHNPDFVQVKGSAIPTKNPSISLRPDAELQKICTSGDPEYIRIREQLDPKVIHHVLRGENIPLDDFSISHLKQLSSPYDIRGTSIIVSVWKDLMLYDKLRESKFVQADGMINPMTIVKVGTDGPEGLYPRDGEIEAWRSIIEQAQFDKDFKIVTHNAVDIQRVGYNGQIVDTAADFTMIIDNILMGLMIPKSIMTQEGAAYASASVGLDVMRQRYNSFRVMMANWIEKKIFAPISEIQGFYDLDNKKKKLIVPQVEWNHMTLYDLDNYIAHITTLVERNKVSMRTLDRSLGLNRANENSNIREELIEAAILEKEKAALGQMTLAQLRSLDPEEPIVAQEQEPAVSALPGAGPAGGMPAPGGDLGGLGLPGGDMGGMPPMPTGPDAGPLPGGPELPTPPPT